jgi:hypothetical protein
MSRPAPHAYAKVLVKAGLTLTAASSWRRKARGTHSALALSQFMLQTGG